MWLLDLVKYKTKQEPLENLSKFSEAQTFMANEKTHHVNITTLKVQINRGRDCKYCIK